MVRPNNGRYVVPRMEACTMRCRDILRRPQRDLPDSRCKSKSSRRSTGWVAHFPPRVGVRLFVSCRRGVTSRFCATIHEVGWEGRGMPFSRQWSRFRGWKASLLRRETQPEDVGGRFGRNRRLGTDYNCQGQAPGSINKSRIGLDPHRALPGTFNHGERSVDQNGDDVRCLRRRSICRCSGRARGVGHRK